MITCRADDYELPESRHKIEDKLKCGVYFLLKDDIVVYVGQSTNIISRVWSHRKRGVEFDEFTYVEATRDELNHLEAIYTLKFLPKLNMREDGRPKNPELGLYMSEVQFCEAMAA